MPSGVRRVTSVAFRPTARQGNAPDGRGDAGILIPYAMYQQYGDTRILEENYDMMKKWYGFLEKTAHKKSLKHLFRKEKYRAYTWKAA